MKCWFCDYLDELCGRCSICRTPATCGICPSGCIDDDEEFER